MVCHLQQPTGMCTTHAYTHSRIHIYTYYTCTPHYTTHIHTHISMSTCTADIHIPLTQHMHIHKVKRCIGQMNICKFYLELTDLQSEGAVRQAGHTLSVISWSQRKVELHTSWYLDILKDQLYIPTTASHCPYRLMLHDQLPLINDAKTEAVLSNSEVLLSTGEIMLFPHWL